MFGISSFGQAPFSALPIINSTVELTGVSATALINGFIINVDDIVVPDSLNLYATGSVGSVRFELSKTVTCGCVIGTGYVGAVEFSIGGSVVASGVDATGYVEPIQVSVDDSVAVAGVSATGSVTAITPTSIATPSGTEATGSVSNVSLGFGRTYVLTGVQGIGRIDGDLVINIHDYAYLQGSQGDGYVGTTNHVVSYMPNGIVGTGFIGTPEVGWVLTGVSATGHIGTVIPKVTSVEDFGWGARGWGIVPWGYGYSNGLVATGYVGTAVALPTVIPVGVEAIGYVGTIVPRVIKTPTGVQGTGQIGTITFGGWNTINDYQAPSWAVINDMQEPIAA